MILKLYMLLRSFYLSQNGIEHVQMGIQINAIWILEILSFVTFPLFVKHIQLDFDVRHILADPAQVVDHGQ